MSKDITERILLRAGFKYKGVGVLNIITDGHSIDITCVLTVIDEREWKCITYDEELQEHTDLYIVGNCFHTPEEALDIAKKIRKLLKDN